MFIKMKTGQYINSDIVGRIIISRRKLDNIELSFHVILVVDDDHALSLCHTKSLEEAEDVVDRIIAGKQVDTEEYPCFDDILTARLREEMPSSLDRIGKLQWIEAQKRVRVKEEPI